MSPNVNKLPAEDRQQHGARELCEQVLERIVDRFPAISFACLASLDGKPFAYAGSGEGNERQRFSAITCSLLALGEAFSREAMRNTCSHVTVSTGMGGSIVLVRVPSRMRGYALAVGADASEMLALALRTTLDAAGELALIIDGRG